MQSSIDVQVYFTASCIIDEERTESATKIVWIVQCCHEKYQRILWHFVARSGYWKDQSRIARFSKPVSYLYLLIWKGLYIKAILLALSLNTNINNSFEGKKSPVFKHQTNICFCWWLVKIWLFGTFLWNKLGMQCGFYANWVCIHV